MSVCHSIIRQYRANGLAGIKAGAMRRMVYSQKRVHPVTVALRDILQNDDFTVVQIGAYVGNSANDPLFPLFQEWANSKSALHHSNARLILIEPVKRYFEALQRNYAWLRCAVFENTAVAAEPGSATLYHLDIDPGSHGYPGWLAQLSSLKDDRINHLHLVDNDIKRFYLRNRVEYKVECITFQALVDRYSIRSIDLLQIDIEGYEYELLKTIKFGSVPIRFINYESECMPESRRECEQLLHNYKYRTLDYAQDTFCYRENDKKLIERNVYAYPWLARILR